ncbi:helicase sen1-like [Cystoisospora suis]|uniref:Helicase sen1-like n=1 Tax=Cystoisospora suis TaxID=483139 RepID=A0A2C6LB52_9APIC|nr:helicase sen1-like [Cystoisospora suis]
MQLSCCFLRFARDVRGQEDAVKKERRASCLHVSVECAVPGAGETHPDCPPLLFRAPQWSCSRSEPERRLARRIARVLTCFADLGKVDEEFLLEAAHVTFCTTSVALRRDIHETCYHTLIVDEARQALEINVLPLLKQPLRRVVLVGDPQQLGEFVRSQAVCQAGYGRSLFERVLLARVCKAQERQLGQGVVTSETMERGVSGEGVTWAHIEAASRSDDVLLLTEQHRMHPEISRFPRTYVYGGTVRDATHVTGPSHTKQWSLGCKVLSPCRFFDTSNVPGANEQVAVQGRGSSRYNLFEARVAVALIKLLAATYPPRHQGENRELRWISVGVITFYLAQVAVIEEQLKSAVPHLCQFIRVSAVDSFQGSEQSVIILSTVRNNISGSLDSLGTTVARDILHRFEGGSLFNVNKAVLVLLDGQAKEASLDLSRGDRSGLAERVEVSGSAGDGAVRLIRGDAYAAAAWAICAAAEFVAPLAYMKRQGGESDADFERNFISKLWQRPGWWEPFVQLRFPLLISRTALRKLFSFPSCTPPHFPGLTLAVDSLVLALVALAMGIQPSRSGDSTPASSTTSSTTVHRRECSGTETSVVSTENQLPVFVDGVSVLIAELRNSGFFRFDDFPKRPPQDVRQKKDPEERRQDGLGVRHYMASALERRRVLESPAEDICRLLKLNGQFSPLSQPDYIEEAFDVSPLTNSLRCPRGSEEFLFVNGLQCQVLSALLREESGRRSRDAVADKARGSAGLRYEAEDREDEQSGRVPLRPVIVADLTSGLLSGSQAPAEMDIRVVHGTLKGHDHTVLMLGSAGCDLASVLLQRSLILERNLVIRTRFGLQGWSLPTFDQQFHQGKWRRTAASIVSEPCNTLEAAVDSQGLVDELLESTDRDLESDEVCGAISEEGRQFDDLNQMETVTATQFPDARDAVVDASATLASHTPLPSNAASDSDPVMVSAPVAGRKVPTQWTAAPAVSTGELFSPQKPPSSATPSIPKLVQLVHLLPYGSPPAAVEGLRRRCEGGRAWLHAGFNGCSSGCGEEEKGRGDDGGSLFRASRSDPECDAHGTLRSLIEVSVVELGCFLRRADKICEHSFTASWLPRSNEPIKREAKQNEVTFPVFVCKYWPDIWYVLGRQGDATSRKLTRAFLRCCLGEDKQEQTQGVKGCRPGGALSSVASLIPSKRMQTRRATSAGPSRGAARIVWDEIQSVIKGGHILRREVNAPSLRTRLQAHRAYLRQCAAARSQSGEDCCEFGDTTRAEQFSKLSKLLRSRWKGPSRFFLSSEEYLIRRGDSACPAASKQAAESAAHHYSRAPSLLFLNSADFPFIYRAFKVYEALKYLRCDFDRGDLAANVLVNCMTRELSEAEVPHSVCEVPGEPRPFADNSVGLRLCRNESDSIRKAVASGQRRGDERTADCSRCTGVSKRNGSEAVLTGERTGGELIRDCEQSTGVLRGSRSVLETLTGKYYFLHNVESCTPLELSLLLLIHSCNVNDRAALTASANVGSVTGHIPPAACFSLVSSLGARVLPAFFPVTVARPCRGISSPVLAFLKRVRRLAALLRGFDPTLALETDLPAAASSGGRLKLPWYEEEGAWKEQDTKMRCTDDRSNSNNRNTQVVAQAITTAWSESFHDALFGGDVLPSVHLLDATVNAEPATKSRKSRDVPEGVTKGNSVSFTKVSEASVPPEGTLETMARLLSTVVPSLFSPQNGQTTAVYVRSRKTAVDVFRLVTGFDVELLQWVPVPELLLVADTIGTSESNQRASDDSAGRGTEKSIEPSNDAGDGESRAETKALATIRELLAGRTESPATWIFEDRSGTSINAQEDEDSSAATPSAARCRGGALPLRFCNPESFTRVESPTLDAGHPRALAGSRAFTDARFKEMVGASEPEGGKKNEVATATYQVIRKVICVDDSSQVYGELFDQDDLFLLQGTISSCTYCLHFVETDTRSCLGLLSHWLAFSTDAKGEELDDAICELGGKMKIKETGYLSVELRRLIKNSRSFTLPGVSIRGTVTSGGRG